MSMTTSLKSLLVRDFRSIAGEWTIPLDAQVVLVHGQNGAGKTSLLSALELAATGTISYLDRAGDTAYRRHLHHDGRGSGQVSLEAEVDGGRRSGSALVGPRGAECAPLLDVELSEAFSQRCFLSQSTLSRLFELYAPADGREAESPLIGFVKEILGLDALDSLIDGLYATGHITRAEKLSAQWQAARDRVLELEGLRAGARDATKRSAERVQSVRSELASALWPNETQQARALPSLLAAADEALANRGAADSRAERMREALLRLDAVESALRRGDLLSVDPNEPTDELRLNRAQERLLEWQAARALPAFDWYRAAHPDGSTHPELGALLREIALAAEEAVFRVRDSESQLQRVDELLRRKQAAEAKLSELARQQSELAALRDEVKVGSAAGELASVLVDVLDHIVDGICPVCDQAFLGKTSLRDHILAKVNSLNAEAASLVDLERRAASLAGEQRALTQELQEIDELRQRWGDLASAQLAVDHASRELAEIQALRPILQAGQALEVELASAQEAWDTAAKNRALIERCVVDLDEVATAVEVEPPKGLLPQRIAVLRADAQRYNDELAGEQLSLGAIRRLSDELSLALKQADRDESMVTDVDDELELLSRRIEEAKHRKEAASTLRRDAEALRASTAARVFDEQLNGLWARVFRRLVPTEPFIPQFKHPLPGTRQMRIEVETINRHGEQAATPAAMLSQGNLNTAALSLFLALHFAVPAKLPWLVFDDPVQSMDDVHISNFAALIKQVVRRAGRQVIIAVHQKELFEYLALELTPASPGEQQLQIVLDRTYGQSDIRVQRLEFSEDRSLESHSAA